MTPSEATLVHQGFALIVPRIDRVCFAYCRRLFEFDLSLRALFPEDLQPLVAKLATALATAVRSLDDLRTVLTRAPALGLRLASYAIEPADLLTAGAAFLAALEDELGEAFTEEAHAAWRRVSWTITLVAMEAMGEALASAA